MTTLTIRKAANVEPRKVRWAWKGRLPLGSVSLIAGREGLGKSTTCIELAARASRGQLHGDLHGLPCGSVIASAEDSIETTLVPRLIAAGADLERVGFVSIVDDEENAGAVPGTLTLPRDIAGLGEMARVADARFVFLDPVVSFLPEAINAHRDQHVRRVLAPLAKMAEAQDLAVVGVIHLSKADTSDVLTKISGSIGFAAAARSVLVFGRDPDDPEGENGTRRILAHPKCNVGPQQGSLLCKIEQHNVDTKTGPIETSRLIFDGTTAKTARDLLSQPTSRQERGALEEARAFLRDELADGPRPARDIKTLAIEADIAEATLRRAREIECHKEKGRGSATAGWIWSLKTPPSNGHLEHHEHLVGAQHVQDVQGVPKEERPDSPEHRLLLIEGTA